MTKSRVLLVDDHPLILAGIRSLISSEPDFEIVGEAMTGPEALKKIREVNPDLVIVDISIAGMNGVVLTRRVSAEMPGLRVLVLTLHEDRTYLTQALDAGARGYVVKRSAAENLVLAMRAVLGGGIYVDPAVAHRVLQRPSVFNRAAVSAIRELSERGAEVLKLSSLGLTNKEIASRIGVGVKSIETFKSRGLGKLEIQTRADLLRYAAQAGWLADV
ncbi:MAG: response regulator transcription factor [Rhodopseudomonas sp.]|uniref:response regulator transcription factor n=1 Tax=Rhodopseudomonas sp. TaxID=1078 RepID=UPI00181C01BC|nr:response regulator transcription factor [Rhodopseudomonas sp.]NVN88584.1 response regulator transcription factor [Rhodopseudomonas sp.]